MAIESVSRIQPVTYTEDYIQSVLKNKRKPAEAFKIVEVVDDQIKTLFHGVDRSRVMEPGIWIEGDVKTGRDGTGKKWYKTGWHSLPSLEEAEEYMTRFTQRTDRLHIAQCQIKDVWLKPQSPNTVFLSRWIKFGDIVK